MATESSAAGIDSIKLTDINLSDDKNKNLPTDNVEAPAVKKKVPRRILHFSDGTLEEYSTSEEEEEDQVDNTPKVNPFKSLLDPKTLRWIPWFWYYTVRTGMRALNNYCGENIAWALGITSPKYQYAIDEYNRMQKEEQEEKERELREEEAERTRRLKSMEVMEGGNINSGFSGSSYNNLKGDSTKQQKY